MNKKFTTQVISIKKDCIPFRYLASMKLCFILVLLMSIQTVLASSVVSDNGSLIKGDKNIEGTYQAAQKITLIGRITSSKGDGLPGVDIYIKDSNINATSGRNGAYSIEVPKKGSTIVFDYVGYEVQERVITNQTVLNVVLKPESTSLNQVVVIGYGSTPKRELVGSVAQVNVDALQKAPVGSYDEALAGRVAGLQVSSPTGQPGTPMNIIIRGANSLTQVNTPLYVVDGTPIENFKNAALNPEEIETINVLKDATAVGIYGSRGANGVIVIETKRGKVGNSLITFNTSVGFQQPKKMEMMSPYDFVRYQIEANPAAAGSYTPADLAPTDPLYNANGRTLESYKDIDGIDWQDLITRTSPIQIHNIAMRGGTSQTKYSFSGSVFNQQGTIRNSDAKRYQGRVTIDQMISHKMRMGITANFSRNLRSGQAINLGNDSDLSSYALYRAWGYRPVSGDPAVNLEDYTIDPDYASAPDVRINPLTSTLSSYKQTKESTFHASAYLEYDILKNLVFKSTGSLYHTRERLEHFYNSATYEGNPLINPNGVNGGFLFAGSKNLLTENTFTYNNTFNNYHKVTLMGGISYQKGLNNTYGYSVDRIPQELLGMYGLDEGSVIKKGGISGGGNYGFLSYYARANYNYKSKYLLTATFRADDASVYDKKNTLWGYSPAVGVAWNMKRESFLRDVDALSSSKLRGSYGISGNNRMGSFGFDEYLAYAYAANSENPKVAISTLTNPGIRWESTKQIDVGYDVGFLKNRIELSLDWYKKNTGFSNSYRGVSSIQNTGFELSFNTLNIQSKSFQWQSSFNINFNKNKVLGLANGMDAIYSKISADPNASPLYVSKVGSAAGMFYGYLSDGIYQVEDFNNPSPGVYTLKNNIPDNGTLRSSVQPGDVKYKDLNDDGTIDDADMTVIGRSLPIHFGGFLNNFSYKSFDLNVFFQWSYGNKLYNANRMMFEGNSSGSVDVNQYASYNDRWTPENRSNELFRAGGQGPAGYQSSRVLEDGSYLRLKTVSLGYTLPKNVVKSIYLSNLRVFASAQNLLTFTSYSGLDPEASARNSVLTPGFDYSVYPQTRMVSFGINATF